MTTRTTRIAYWALTGVFAGLMALSGAMYVAGASMIRDTFAHLGYPPYMLKILGGAKLMGVVALLQYRVPTLREWAYAGFTINLVGAIASHLFSGDSTLVASVPAMFLVVLAASYALKPAPKGIVVRSDNRHVGIAA